MTLETIVAAALSVLILIYLIYTLLRPERF
jgi:K+-transporting ATPase KdpF subunit